MRVTWFCKSRLGLVTVLWAFGQYIIHQQFKNVLKDTLQESILESSNVKSTNKPMNVQPSNMTDHLSIDLSVQTRPSTKVAMEHSDSNPTASSFDFPSIFPTWMKTYFSWHATQMLSLNQTNWESHKYLILRCTLEDRKCGGLADRLKPLPYFLLIAARTNRIFMIRWSTPARLEEFLLPNKLNWSVPEWMEKKIANDEVSRTHKIAAVGLANFNTADNQAVVIETKLQDVDGGASLYQQLVVDPQDTYEAVFHTLFRVLFKPSPPIDALVKAKMKEDNLIPGEYVVAHYRAFYAIESQKEERSDRELKRSAINAVACASNLRPGGPVYFASDSKVAIAFAKSYGREWNHSVSALDSDEALHLDKYRTETPPPLSSFYSIFVDLLLMANGRCVTYGQGGFGRFASLLSYNATCNSRHIYQTRLLKCAWREAA